jgi:hypothetical protein
MSAKGLGRNAQRLTRSDRDVEKYRSDVHKQSLEDVVDGRASTITTDSGKASATLPKSELSSRTHLSRIRKTSPVFRLVWNARLRSSK